MDSQLRSRQIRKAGSAGQDCSSGDADTSLNEPVTDDTAAKGPVGCAQADCARHARTPQTRPDNAGDDAHAGERPCR